MPQSKQGDVEKTLEFIEDYRSFVLLWDVNHEFYTNKNERKAAIESLGIKYNMNEREVKNKIKCLRSYFAKEHQKLMDTGRSYWFAYDALQFTLVTKNDPKKRYYYDEDDGETPSKSFTQDETAEGDASAEPVLTQRSKKKRRIRDDSSTPFIPKISSVESNGMKAFQRVKDPDEFDVFGQMVASQIRKFSRRNQAVAKNTIQNFLFDMEMRELDETPAPVQETVLQSLDPSSPPQIAKHANTAEIDGVIQAALQ